MSPCPRGSMFCIFLLSLKQWGYKKAHRKIRRLFKILYFHLTLFSNELTACGSHCSLYLFSFITSVFRCVSMVQCSVFFLLSLKQWGYKKAHKKLAAFTLVIIIALSKNNFLTSLVHETALALEAPLIELNDL